MNILSIDFETANSARCSVCSVGIAIIVDRELVHSQEWLVRPHRHHGHFDWMNISIHGITAKDVAGKPEFNTVFAELLPFFEQADAVIAHNAAFDISVLRGVLDIYQHDYPELDYLCTCKAAAKIWPELENHKLNTVSNHLSHHFNHHNAEADAIAAGKIFIAALERLQVNDHRELASAIGMKTGKLHKSGYTPCSIKKSKSPR
jgi:DNA polymerase-3 subunit epsilon